MVNVAPGTVIPTAVRSPATPGAEAGEDAAASDPAMAGSTGDDLIRTAQAHPSLA